MKKVSRLVRFECAQASSVRPARNQADNRDMTMLSRRDARSTDARPREATSHRAKGLRDWPDETGHAKCVGKANSTKFTGSPRNSIAPYSLLEWASEGITDLAALAATGHRV